MKRTNLLACACYLSLAALMAEGYLGLNWGRMATQRMIPSMVVDMLLQNNISNVKIYSASDNVLEALGGTNISVAITMPNFEMKYVNETRQTDEWIRVNVQKFLDQNVTFKYIFVGTQPLSTKFFIYTFPDCIDTFKTMQQSLDNLSKSDPRLSEIKVIMGHYIDVLDNKTTVPSQAEFRPELIHNMTTLCRTLQAHNSPFGIDVFPLVAVEDFFKSDVEFAFFENNSTSKFTDGSYTYSNVFEVMYDSFVIALGKLGFPDMPILVEQIGWPTDGGEPATVQNAERFHQGLAKFVAGKQGTPRRPGSIDVYIHNLADENALRLSAGPYFRHWGIYKFDGQPKFNLDFTGQGRPIKPVSAVGLTHMPKRWCVLNPTTYENGLIPYEVLDRQWELACNTSDCTATMPGGSCSGLGFPQNYSYAFNMAFQASNQNLQKCNFEGFGTIVVDDPSVRNCTFPVEILAAEIPNYYGQRSATQNRSFAPKLSAAVLKFLFTMFALMYTLGL